MKFWSSQYVFQYDWETVASAAWRKYPNPLKPEVTGIDILGRAVSDDGVLKTTRVIRTEWRIPRWATSLIGLENPSYALEHSEVSAKSKQMLLKTTNLNCRNFVSVHETLQYTPDPVDSTRTLMEQSVCISVRGVPLISYMESILTSTFSFNADKVCVVFYH
ncbi:unnamed protein product [Soboliphyme baturini]|uniref:PRELI/MSF1 domain-containing protein n=1 Tax=Soboliphyme baturini TaxID=241478 RepID=A0A183J159_9BILA|nr:unnamed protein product [Soboliphyme baturini]